MSKVDVFRALHRGRLPGDPLVLPGPWDAVSARVCEEAGFPALATPSAAIAASLGHEDGSTPADEMFAAVARIAKAVDIPVSADVESGYGLAPKELVERLLEAGAVGCNLEDSEHGVLRDPREHADRLAEVRYAAGDQLFVNARVDTFSCGDGDPERAIERAALYVAAGADCVYPIGAPVKVLPLLRSGIQGPLNVFGRLDGEGPSPTELGELGATRVTFGPGLQRRAALALRGTAAELRKQ
ncbi:2-methylisocitrate lyase-like PEP mutase family enzyme [Streptomyces sp. SAI-208]|uniref:isocitrate lyase/PEP mutase family protein n=1 Tax=unclassified Streptomyces TaxID=2593676 RepID=UPI002472FD0E|nr:MULTISPECIES: isocitrate lyase/phosphoenolpyruvate mutase family protein [unclassified Streptomyces]MDH6516990.1 2-methylisocitrate lyase-like PEP mutase family enzyme [Streptomyces sp. SAI-090]MDH6549207.1 2-methylisocitrate lyase-like PEP mutase family enzyme [Streptomyces sp. SAI-041]MDH6568272.1 2-methylisocitrate lyase-like PEP mutase family enzyme [Streptomyces sp. SAI-117]MDH6586779.1 2-methylisocitrate lyase-like PEP mutase family enzyme [Streptomyces sp. SAI-133]MDH6607811.1 2-meth